METGVFHRYLFEKFKETNLCRYKNTIKYNYIVKILAQHRIPRFIQYKFLKEMENMCLIKIQDKKNIILINQEDKIELEELLETKTLTEISKIYGVSVNTVSEWEASIKKSRENNNLSPY